jgi:hypothetical protein
MGLIKTAVLTFVLAVFTFVVLTFIGALTEAAPSEVAGTAGALSESATLLRPAMPVEYAWVLLVAALAVAGVHALFRRKQQEQV